MGDASPPEKEYILCILPFPENSSILDPIRKKHPNVEFDYNFAVHIKGEAQNCNITDGMVISSIPDI
jgi:hypothetical protein